MKKNSYERNQGLPVGLEIAIKIIVGVAFAVLGVIVLRKGGNPLMCWFAIVFFGLGGLFMAYLLVKEKLTRQPFLLITDECVRINVGKGSEIRYAEVDSFFLTKAGYAKMIGIKYKEGIESQKEDEANKVGRVLRGFNTRKMVAPDAIPVDDLTMKPKEILEILNERLK